MEMRRRNKAGGIMDRRFGENDPKMAPEERSLQRFIKEKERADKRGTVFDLEEEEEDQGELTHLGKSLSFKLEPRGDDFDKASLSSSDVDLEGERRGRKRQRISRSANSPEGRSDSEDSRQFEKPKTKKEVMEEIITKSKLHKYERQKAKDDDDDLRAELDQDVTGILALIKGPQHNATSPHAKTSTPSTGMNPDRAALINGKDRQEADREYDERLRQMTYDKRSKPTERTKTEEEQLRDEADRLKELENQRLRRMRGENEQDEEEDVDPSYDNQEDEDMDVDEGNSFGLGAGIPAINGKIELDAEDEDDFLIEDNLVAGASDVDSLDSDGPASRLLSEYDGDEDDDRELADGLLSEEEIRRPEFELNDSGGDALPTNEISDTLAFTYSCPQSHEEFLRITKEVSVIDLPTVVQRIRALYHPKLHADNKAKLGRFSMALVDHVAFLANQPSHPPFAVLETLIRHVHSLTKSFPLEVGRAFRSNLKSLHETRPTAPRPGDLVLLTAIAQIFPTSDHFHQITTPAMLLMARYLDQKIPTSLAELAIGSYIGSLCMHYQSLSKRYIPELLNYTVNALLILSPFEIKKVQSCFHRRESLASLRIRGEAGASNRPGRPLRFWDVMHKDGASVQSDQELKVSLFGAFLSTLNAMADMWSGKSADCEILGTCSQVLRQLSSKDSSMCLDEALRQLIQDSLYKVRKLLLEARRCRRPLLLHNHRPLAIKSSIPKFEESYNPDKHYDPNRDRAEFNKLKAEHKRERKGALRELRKDANFIARESLREKKERDSQYEKKYKRLIAEIQTEEGKEANAYEREKRLRKGKR